MTRKVQLGAPSLTGKDANDVVAEAFADLTYPSKFEVTNLMPRNVTFPEVGGLFLRNVASRQNDVKAVVTIMDHDQLQRLASSVEQIAELNKYAVALTVEALEAPKVAETAATAETVATPVADTSGAASATQGDGEAAKEAETKPAGKVATKATKTAAKQGE